MASTPYELATRFLGLREVPGPVAAPMIVAMLELESPTITSDEVPWCSAFVNFVAWLAGLERSGSLGARSWLKVGQPVDLSLAVPGDVVVLQRGLGPQPGPEIVNAPGHVGFFVGLDGNHVKVLGGNQSNAVSIISEPASNVLGVRRLGSVVT